VKVRLGFVSLLGLVITNRKSLSLNNLGIGRAAELDVSACVS
jgi:hypothetical protein